MPKKTETRVLVRWYLIDDVGRRTSHVICEEDWGRRRASTCVRDLVDASPDDEGSVWYTPSDVEVVLLDLDPKAGTWVIQIGQDLLHDIKPQKHAVLLTEVKYARRNQADDHAVA